eukprot:911877_1
MQGNHARKKKPKKRAKRKRRKNKANQYNDHDNEEPRPAIINIVDDHEPITQTEPWPASEDDLMDLNDDAAIVDDDDGKDANNLNRIQELEKENSNLKQQIRQLEQKAESKNERCYIRDEVLEYNSIDKKEIQMRPQINQQQTNIDNAFDIHANRLLKWNTFQQKLLNEFDNFNNNPQQNDEKEGNHDDDDEKRKHPEKAVQKLLNSYRNCTELLHQQQSRAEDIVEYAISLSKTKKQLKSTVDEYAQNQTPREQKYNKLCAEYTNLKEKREELQQQVMQLIAQINAITNEENTTNKGKCDTLDNLNVAIKEKERYDELLIKCKSLTAKYNQFETHVDQKTDDLCQYFAEKWDDHERLWTKWDVDDIMCWIQYLVHDNKVTFSKQVQLDEIKKEMKSMETTGKSLEEIEKTDLKLFGFTVFDDITQLYKRIRELVSKYPVGSYITDDGNNMEGGIQETPPKIQVPEAYICPISGKIMMDPVIYDDVTYDRSHFLQYVSKLGTIPDSDETYDKDEGLFKNRKLKQKIDAFLCVNPQFREEGV